MTSGGEDSCTDGIAGEFRSDRGAYEWRSDDWVWVIASANPARFCEAFVELWEEAEKREDLGSAHKCQRNV